MEDKLYWLWLTLKDEIHTRDQFILSQIFGGARGVYESISYDREELSLTKEIKDALMDKSLTEAERVYKQTEEIGGYIITIDDERYPHDMMTLSVPPLLLYCRGEYPDWEKTLNITVVGTRNYCDYGKRATEEIVRGLASYGVTIVSGMARGIDAIAGCAALHEGGKTVAVLGSGLDVIYPPEYKSLYNAIIKNGVVMTEFPPGTRPLKQNFPRRNRIMAGLSLGLLVGQAPIKSGSLITAAHAIATGRNIYVVPSDIYDRRFAGSNELIKEGAKLVRCAEDIIEDFSYMKLEKHPKRKRSENKRLPDLDGLSTEEIKIVKLLSRGRMHVDELARACEMSSSEVNTALMMLEINGTVKKHSGNIYGIN